MNKLSKSEKGFGAVETVLILVIIVLIGAVGYLVYKNHHQTPKVVTRTVTVSSKTSPSSSSYTGWKQYCSTYEKSCFKYPSSWTFTNDCSASAACSGIDNVTVTSPNKSMINFESSIIGRGGDCQPNSADSFITSVTPLPDVKGLYLVQFSRADIDSISFGVDDTVNGAIPKTGDTGSCLQYTAFTAKNTPNAGVDLSGTVPNAAKSADLGDAIKTINSYYYQ